MHGLGNDFVLLDLREQAAAAPLSAQRASELCERHTGIGADGVLTLLGGALALSAWTRRRRPNFGRPASSLQTQPELGFTIPDPAQSPITAPHGSLGTLRGVFRIVQVSWRTSRMRTI